MLQHEAIVDAIAKGEGSYAELMVRLHLESVRREFRELWLNSD